MSFDLLAWLGLGGQIAGAVLLALTGGFGFGSRKRAPRGIALGLALFCTGCVSLAVYAFNERHFLLTVIQLVAAVLVALGVARKSRDKRDGR